MFVISLLKYDLIILIDLIFRESELFLKKFICVNILNVRILG